MPKVTNLKDAKENLEALCNQAAETREPIIIERPDGVNVAIISAEELEGLMETAHLVRSHDNAQRLLEAIAGTDGEKGHSVDDIRRALGLPPE
ncbi:MAG: type II toxin-antitoxin system Phd/YefM family antitoxin [Planctomycetota bacterium]|jgi:antitoxin YefM